MRAITYAIVTLILVGLTLQQCGPGCSRCSNNNVCLACDSSRFAVLRPSNVCQVSNIQNCALVAQNNTCIQCNPGFSLGGNTCTAVTGNALILNCAIYSGPSTCRVCIDGAIMVAGQCRLVNNPIPQCRTYNADGTCLRCNTGFTVAANLTGCVATGIPNCQAASFIKCRTCANGYNFANITAFAAAVQYDTIQNFANNVNVFRSGPWAPQAVCMPTYNYTCVNPQSPNCIPPASVPAAPPGNPAFPNCITYITSASGAICSVCAQGFQLAATSAPSPAGTFQCNPVAPVPNCATYNNNDSVGACNACVNGFFLNANGNCVVRTNPNIAGCATFRANQDSCDTCNPGLIISSDRLTCFPPLPNCQNYVSLTAFYPINNCALCNNGFFINATNNMTNCTQGNVTNCSIYNVYDNSCAICQPGAFLNNGMCLPHAPIANCTLYDVTNGIKCRSCNNTGLPFTILSRCVPTVAKPGCTDYANDGLTCTVCARGFYLNNGICSVIPATLTNCVAYSGTACTGCAPGFILNTAVSPNACMLPLDYVVGNSSLCGIVAPVPAAAPAVWTAAGQIQCAGCAAGSAPYVPNFNEAICVNNTQLALSTDYAVVANCARYGRSLAANTPMVCVECARGYFISGYQALGPFTTATTCVLGCVSTAAQAVAQITDDFYGFVNICVPVAGTGYVIVSATCSKYARANVAVTTAASATYISDFICLTPTPMASGVTYPTSFLLYDAAANVGVNTRSYEKMIYNNVAANAATYAANAPWDFSNGWSNTIDNSASAQQYPLVFNYRGLLTATAYSANPMIRLNVAADSISATSIKLNNFANCDIIANTPTVNVGFAFTPTSTSPPFAPATIGTTYYHCFRCAFGYGLSYTGGAAASATSPFPSCAAVSLCNTSRVWGGLPRYLNSLLSCHVCNNVTATTPAFPTIALEIDAVTVSGGTAKTGIVMGFQPDQAYTLSGTNTVAAARSGFKCAAAPAFVATSNTLIATFAQCAAYANLRNILTYATAAAAPTVTALPIYNASTTATAADNNVCLACNPGFFPTYLDTTAGSEATSFTANLLPGWVVSACTASQYCAPNATGMFNGCPQCDPRIAPSAGGSAAYNDFTFANCVLTSATNCLMAEGVLDATTVNTCTVCKGGFYLTADNQCDQIIIPNQPNTSSFVPNAYLKAFNPTTFAASPAATPAIRDLRIAYLHKFNVTNYGVNNCTAGYTRFPIHAFVNSVCAASGFLAISRGRFNSAPANTNFIANCAVYVAYTVAPSPVPSTLRCYQCMAPFVVSQDQTTCVLFPVPTLCQIAANPSNNPPAPNLSSMTGPKPNITPLCYQCVPGAVYADGMCLTPAIPGCVTFTQTATTGSLPITCAVCNDTLALSGNALSCNPGPTTNCRAYNADGLTCNACLQNFLLVTLKGKPFCIPAPLQLGCATVDTANAINFNLQCTKCNNALNNSFALQAVVAPTLVTAAPADTCLPISPIPNCLAMGFTPRALNAPFAPDFTCTTCAPGFFWDAPNLWCRPRTVQPPQCATFTPNANTCATCLPNFYLSTDGTTCTAFPSTVGNCFSTSASGACLQCATGFFLNGGYCLPVTRTVAACIFYVNDGVCVQCGLGQVAVNNGTLCAFPVATNCSTWVTPNSCASCPPTTYLSSVTYTNITNVTNPTTGAVVATTVATTIGVCLNLTIANCSIGFVNGTCTQCLPNFYFTTARACSPVTTIINGCVTYASATTCQTCAPGSVLSFDSSSCIPGFFNNLADINCQDSFVDTKPSCVTCNAGFYLDRTGACVACTTGANCAYCNPNVPDQCILCAPGFNMDATGACASSANAVAAWA